MRTVQALLLVAAVMPAAASAQIVPPMQTTKAVTDPVMVIDDRGSQLEILEKLRAIPETQSDGRTVYRVVTVAASSRIGPSQFGVAFNHALQKQGFLTGEIAFKMKGDQHPSGFDPYDYPGLAKVINPNVYEVVVGTPREFVDVYNRLKGRNDLEWVEPVLIHGASVN